MKIRIIYITILFSICCTRISALTPLDSIRAKLPTLKGEELLQAHSNMCRLAAAGADAGEELACQHAYIDEAHRKHNAESEGQARSMLMMSFYNYDMPDSTIAQLPATLHFMKKNQLWDHYTTHGIH